MSHAPALNVKGQKDALRLYQEGLSAKQVAVRLEVGMGAVYYALRKHGVVRRSIIESNRLQFESRPLSFKIKHPLTQEEGRLKFAAVLLYWAEGYKAGGNTIDFANSDPQMALIFRKFLSEICGIDEKKLRAALYCYEGKDIQACTRFWSRLLSIPAQQFTKPYIKRAAPGPRGPRMIHGLVHIRYCDKRLLRQVLNWIGEYQLELTK